VPPFAYRCERGMRWIDLLYSERGDREILKFLSRYPKSTFPEDSSIASSEIHKYVSFGKALPDATKP
jgi:hypothetical protein